MNFDDLYIIMLITISKLVSTINVKLNVHVLRLYVCVWGVCVYVCVYTRM